ncbi:hybrid sensor histidine kinase/response regulator [Pseudanabaena sp. ABRG5-3]|uniref:hybrid sensor histidine kinase/response regulator n=1 Tax=Pseudanabaena sp. ABRG5-3 TaxID=685565 RepID=UPI000DC73797|nr:hybrid sensor histidine kinase/response regulator [Pseudanabaena sp. ABRG5-3]BBC24101.1 response regulator receiver sensor signal transduction histidine kinase [Pseudanabaena sp. ABRG5-3]
MSDRLQKHLIDKNVDTTAEFSNLCHALEGCVLVVDDNPTNLSVLVNLLRDVGLRVLVATDGESAIEQIEYVKPDLILLDVMMPGIDGFETCQRLKANVDTAKIPIIFMTALSETVDKVRGLSLGAVDYITKPFEHEEVLVRIRTHLMLAKQRQTIELQNIELQTEIAERKRAEEALTIFLHAVSHDLRNPVTGLIMVLEQLSNNSKTADEPILLPRTTLERMRQSGDRQLALINSLLESHVNDVHGIIIHPQLVAIGDIISAVIYDLQPILEKEDATVVVQIEPELNPIWVDAAHIYRVFQNLIVNAIKHNPPNLKLTISANNHTENMILCEVIDNGVGMTHEQSEILFELYAQGNAQNKLNRRSLSLGLGLYICRQIVQAHGGAIGAIGELNVGSRFWFTLANS